MPTQPGRHPDRHVHILHPCVFAHCAQVPRPLNLGVTLTGMCITYIQATDTTNHLSAGKEV